MSHLITNFELPSKPFTYDEKAVSAMTVTEFDALPLSDQVGIYNRFPSQYSRLTGRDIEVGDDIAPGSDTGSKSDSERFADEFERRLDEALARAFPTAEL